MAQPLLVRPPATPTALVAALDQLDRFHDGLAAAHAATTPAERYVAAHLAALRAAAAVLAVRGRPSRGRRGRTLNVWELLPRVAPELAEWAVVFSASASRRAAVEAGRVEVVNARDADDLLRDAEAFAVVVAEILGVPRKVPRELG